MNRLFRTALLAALGAVATLEFDILAQSPAPSFEVASIKRNKSGDGFVGRGFQPGGTTFVNVPVRQLIQQAYGVQPFQVIGGPAWINVDRFDITAKAEGTPPPDQMNLMLRSLLAERFKLVARPETRELPVYYLVKAREDGQLGAALKPSTVDCAAARGRLGPPGPPPGGGGPAPGPLANCRMTMAPGRLAVAGQPMSQFATMLGPQVQRPVIDKTGLTGRYDFEVSFMPEGRGGMPLGPPPPGAPPLPPIDPDAPSMFTALQEQLGLKLDSGRGPVEVIVIDSIEPPTED
jgi:bla regulator protein blaR1